MDEVVPEKVIPAAPFLQPQEALKTLKVPEGFAVELVASEPLLDKPVALDFDATGRMWVCEMRSYMTDVEGSQEGDPMGRIVVLEDRDGDGRAETRHLFLDGLVLPRAIHLYEDGVLYADDRSLFFIKRDGVKPVGESRVIDDTYTKGGNVEHKANGLLAGRDNWLYSAKSEARYRREGDEFRKERTHFRGQWGIAQDDWGRLIFNSNSVSLEAEDTHPQLLVGSDQLPFRKGSALRPASNACFPSRVTPGINRAYVSKANGYDHNVLNPETYKSINVTSACGPVVCRGSNFPEHMHNWAVICDTALQFLKAIEMKRKDEGRLVGLAPYKNDEFLTSVDERFRPVNLYNAPDGSLYCVDFYHGIIQHRFYMTSYLRKQIFGRGLEKPELGHGRLYRIRQSAKDLEKKTSLEGASLEELVTALAHPNGWHRDMAQRLLVERQDAKAVALLRAVLEEAKASEVTKNYAMWCLEGLDALQVEDLQPLLEKGGLELQLATLYAALSLPVEEREALNEQVKSLPDEKRFLPYKACFLAESREAASHEFLANWLQHHHQQPLVVQAALTGLRDQAGRYLAAHAPANEEMKEGLQKLTAGKKVERHPEQALKGEHLASYQRGKAIFEGMGACMGCHGNDGTGLPNLGPELDGSDWVTGDPERLVKVLLHGLQGPIHINGKKFVPMSFMPGVAQNPVMDDVAVADVLTYIRGSWSNEASQIQPAFVAEVRQATADRNGRVYTEKELSQKAPQ